MPLAFDLTSTLAKGSILPVATTDRAMSPRSTLASFEGSISWLGRSATATPTMVPTTPTRATLKKIIRRRLRLFLWLPFIDLPRSRNSSCPMLKYECEGKNVHSVPLPLPEPSPNSRVPACLDGRSAKTSPDSGAAARRRRVVSDRKSVVEGKRVDLG